MTQPNDETLIRILETMNRIAVDVAETKAMVRSVWDAQHEIAGALAGLGIEIDAPMSEGEPIDVPADLAAMFGLSVPKDPPKEL